MNDLELLLNCPICGNKYGYQSAKLVQRNEEGSLLLHVECKHCSSASLALIARAKGNDNVITMGIMTDLNYEEACNVLQKKPVSINEVLEVYQGFKK